MLLVPNQKQFFHEDPNENLNLKGRVENWVVRGQPGQLVPRVEVDAVEVEEGGVDEEEHVDVGRQQEGDHEQRSRPEKLKENFNCNLLDKRRMVSFLIMLRKRKIVPAP